MGVIINNKYINLSKNILSHIINPFFGASDTNNEVHSEYTTKILNNGITLKEGRKILAPYYMYINNKPIKYNQQKDGFDLFILYMIFINSLEEEDFKDFVTKAQEFNENNRKEK